MVQVKVRETSWEMDWKVVAGASSFSAGCDIIHKSLPPHRARKNARVEQLTR